MITSRTLGNRPTGPSDTDKFVYANTTYLSLRLDAWNDHKCEILYFVVEYKLESSTSWTTGKRFSLSKEFVSIDVSNKSLMACTLDIFKSKIYPFFYSHKRLATPGSI